MRKIKYIILVSLMIISSAYLTSGPLQNLTLIESASSFNKTAMKQDLLCLMMAYPAYISNIVMSRGQVYLVTKSGKRILYDDRKSKDIHAKISYPDLQDMMEQTYSLKTIDRLMDIDHDPGRIRVYSLLNEVYGESRGQVEGNLVNINIGGRSFKFNRENQAAAALKNTLKELAALTEQRQDIRAYVYPCEGTYNYRVISGTNRLSAHAYGIAIDFSRNDKDYWKWASRKEGEKRISSYPKEVVELFEKNNFIWGGKWGHFDIMHFEYRPEIIIKARFFGSAKTTDKPWYRGVPLEEKHIRDYIKKIDEAIR